ncbi:MAG: serine/threonine-protein kinase [Bacteroidota bacterium]
MRACPTCQTEYSDEVGVCARDGQALVAMVAGTGAAAGAVAAAGATGGAASAPGVVGLAPGGAPRGGAASAPAPVPIGILPAPSAEIFDSLVGATLAGRYLIIRRIGEGGMGAVYEAKHTIIGKRVAVKVLLEKFLTKSDFVARLLQEARLASAIGHEHIVDVTDFGTTDDGRAFVAMEFLEGESLAQLVMREAPLPVERSLRIARQVASALGAAHAKGIVHRDVKPENVYLIRRGDADFVKVVDFGISKAVKQGQGDDTPDYRLTHTGLLLGTPLYMSPEQARGDEDLDERVDVWAMGVLMYECLTGEVPFRANNYLGIISQVLTHHALPPSKLRPELGIPEAVEAVVMHAMEKDRNRRYARMDEVEQDIDRLLAGDQNVGTGVAARPSTVPPPSSPARGRMWVWGAAVAALVCGVAMVLARPEGPTSAGTAARAEARAAEVPPPGGATPPASTTTTDSTADGTSDKAAASRPGARSAAVVANAVGAKRAADLSRAQRPIRPVRQAAKVGAVGGAEHGGDNASPRPGEHLPSKPANPVIRGALPSRSGEGYPDN